MDQSAALISEAKAAVEDPTAPNKQLRLAQAAKAVSQALNQVVNCLPGQIEFDQAIKAIAQASLTLQSGKVSLEEEVGGKVKGGGKRREERGKRKRVGEGREGGRKKEGSKGEGEGQLAIGRVGRREAVSPKFWPT